MQFHAPNFPAGHCTHAADPAGLYKPTPHGVTVGFVEPLGHVYPALHGPLHWLVFRLG